MLKNIALLVAGLAVLLPVLPSAAQEVGKGYVGVSYAQPKIKVEGIRGFSMKPDLGILTMGVVLNPNLAAELFIGAGLSDETKSGTILGQNVRVRLRVKESYGIYVRPFVDLGPNMQIYGRLGYVSFKAKSSLTVNGVDAGSVTDKEDDFSYGAGIAFNLSPDTALTLDYTKFFDKDGVEAAGVGLGLRFTYD
jgi:opacity protein-like surface antigen